MSRLLHPNPGDPVAIALDALAPGDTAGDVTVRDAIPAGHKIAVRGIAAGEPVRKFGHVIGRATRAIGAGEHVHVHNLAFEPQATAQGIARDVPPALPPRDAWFDGYLRDDGRVGTRNFIGILTSVNCSASVARAVERHFTPERLSPFANVDGVAAFTHQSGCGLAHDGQGIANLRRTIAGYARHPNFAGIVLIGLGCEVNQVDPLLSEAGLTPSDSLRVVGIQDTGGTRAAIAAGIAAVEAMLPLANAERRSRMSAAHLTIGMQCGGSDGYSALTANPALGRAADRLVAAGGRVVLSETPEIFGAEDLLLARATNGEVAEKLTERIDWWQDYASQHGADLNNNPSPGNIAGGITTILEKSLGAVAKAGLSPLNAVIDYAAPITAPGLTFMDSPGYDPASATGQIAGGANLVVFTTGRGSVFGSKPAPTIKIASNSALAAHMAEDIDLDCGRLLLGEVTLDQLGDEMFKLILRIASGTPSASEQSGLGGEEFVPWVPGAMF
ncbi:UxaA family hydrolase [Sphingomonas sp. AX6]|uniref:UxaA family hydrolase n=1 Tax=Sphingomonas sp. AX6 TaxID=2653171 RepID=UPI0012F10DC4|nr:altronate dehydratase family protein [Sphingomonas sp. AX6]VXC44881.1 Altronate hydrolase [Sphingomonas sp. AX6]